MGSKRVNLEKEEDRISPLPDSIIQHILSFLPSTKESIRTGILSKRWQNQWTQVPLLIFNSTGMSYENFLKFIEYTLIFHDCSKIKKFHLEYHYPNRKDPHFAAKIRFATRKHVEKLTLSLRTEELLPTFLFDHASLVELNAVGCAFMPNGKVNWGCLAALSMVRCRLTAEAIEHILSGTPSLESLELTHVHFTVDKLVIASKSLKILVLTCAPFNRIEISCPKLEKLSLTELFVLDVPELFARAIENVLSHSSLLESFELRICQGYIDQIPKLVIASKSLKRLVLEDFISSAGALEISCPNLEQLKLFKCLRFETAKLLNLPSSLCATVDFYLPCRELIEDVLQSLQHVRQLEIGGRLFKALSLLKGGWSLPMLNTKCLILNSGDLNEYPYEIARLLRTFHVLEELVIKVPHCYPKYLSRYHEDYDYHEQLNDKGENYWNSDKTVFKCLVSHLKTLKIIGFPYRDHNRKLVLNFVQFLLKNARLLEKMVVELKDETTVILKVSQELLSLPKCSRHAVIELLCSE